MSPIMTVMVEVKNSLAYTIFFIFTYYKKNRISFYNSILFCIFARIFFVFKNLYFINL